MLLTRFARRLLRDTSGQVLLFGAIVVFALVIFMLAIPNGTQAVTQKMRVQTAADAGAFTGSVWLARALNLNANMNIGVKSIYEWMTVLTMAEALAQALCADTFDTSVMTMGQDVANALFGNPDPYWVALNEYPLAITNLGQTGLWLQELGSDVAESFTAVAQTMGSYEACRNASGGNPLSQNPAGRVLVWTNDSVPMLVETAAGDSLIYDDLIAAAASLESIPTNDSNIGPATGLITVDSSTMEITAYYGMLSMWLTLSQKLRLGQTIVNQWYAIYPVEPDTNEFIFSAHRYYANHTDPRLDSATGKSWLGNGLPIWFIDSLKQYQPTWRCYGKKSFSVPHEGETAWVHQRHWKYYSWPGDTGLHELPPPDTADPAWPYIDSGWEIIQSGAYNTDFYEGAESTNGNQGPKLHPRRVNPDRGFHAVAYAWRLGAATSPRGLGAPMGGALFPRSKVAPPSPLLTFARSLPYLAVASPTEEDYFFNPAWDVKLSPIDSIAVQDLYAVMASDTLNLDDSLNLEDLRKYVLLP